MAPWWSSKAAAMVMVSVSWFLMCASSCAMTPAISSRDSMFRSPVVAATDYMRLFAEQIRPFVTLDGRRYTVLGTDGFGRSDSREKLRHFFEVDRRWITVAALRSLADDGQLPLAKVGEALRKYSLDPAKPNPVKV